MISLKATIFNGQNVFHFRLVPIEHFSSDGYVHILY